MRIITAMCLAVLTASPAWADDLFVEIFESETRANFGSDTPSEYRIEVVLGSTGRAEVLCSKKGYGKSHGVLSYSENGIFVPAIKPKYIKNPELIKQEGLKPGDPSLSESRHYQAKYYAHVSWFFYGFRK